jgi:DNA-binding transcriptional ArsR family regulator
MPTSLLPAIDSAGQLREAAFALLLHKRRPIEVVELAKATGLAPQAMHRAISTLARAGWLDLDEQDRVTGAAGLSLANGPHRLAMGDASFRTWCAYDALGTPAALGADGEIQTACGHCGAAISLTLHGGPPERHGPEELWLAEGDGGDLRGSFCTPTVLLCGHEHGAGWAATQGGHGQLLDLAQAARRSAADWAGCTSAAERLR